MMPNKYTFVVVLLFFCAVTANAATYTITKLSDNKTKSIAEILGNKSDCELREAVQAANSTPEDDVIEFDPNVFGEKQTIVLDGSLRIEGGTKGSLTINGNGVTITAPNNSVILVFPNQTLTLTGTTVAGGSDLFGGGIHNGGTTTLINCTVRDNFASTDGGGIWNTGTVNLYNSTVSGNHASRYGGGINNPVGSATLINSTVTGNSANFGGGISRSNFEGDPYQTILTNTIVAGNTSPTGPDIFAVIDSQSYNLIGNTAGTEILGDTTGNILNQNALLGPLQNNGGPTLTHALLANSPAIDHGNNLSAFGLTDQRGSGFPRFNHRRVDIGAFEAANTIPITATVVDNTSDNGSLSACTAAANDCSLRGAISNSVAGFINAISFDPNVFSAPQTITLTNGELSIAGSSIDVEIRGRNGLTISGNNASRVFLVDQAIFTLYDVTIANGRAVQGGGIFNNFGTLTVNNSTISNNVTTPGGIGGGIFNNNGVVNIFNSTFSGNQANPSAANSGGLGGAIFNLGGSLKLTNSTIAFNTGLICGGIFANSGKVVSGNSIIANNFAARGFDFFGTLTSLGYNIIGNIQDTNIIGTMTGNILNVAANLAPLANNGGPTMTHSLFGGSPALNAGGNALALDENVQPTTTDQRGAGFSRIFGTAVDIGSFESGNPLNLTVDTTGDNGSLSDCTTAASDCSLRGAISRANSSTGNDTITLDPGIFASTQTITLGGSEIIIAANGSLTLNGINGLRISGNNASRIFTVNAAAVVNFNNLTLNGGGNVADGGAIYNSGTVTLTNSTISGNTASNNGGAIYQNGAALSLINSTVSGNVVIGGAGRGGGIYVNSGSVNFTNSTIAYNTANNGGGVFNSGGTVNSGNTIIGNNFGATGFDFSGTLTSQGYNFIGNTSLTNITGVTTGNILNRFIQVGALQNNGGGTFTHAPLSGSPAINAGSNSLALDAANQPLTTDQRGAGFLRILNGRVDIGAFESALLPPPPDFVVDTTSDDGSLSACTAAGNDCSLRGAIATANATAGNETINFDSGVFAASQTITLTNGHIPVSSGSITINGINGLRISGNNASRIFIIAIGATLNLNNLTLTNGFQGGDGGAIFSQGTLNITNSTISANRSTERGGGIFNFAGTVNLVNSTLSGNFLNAVSQGGGIYNLSGTVNATNSTITNNSAGDGGGIYNDSGTVNAGNTIIAGNNSATSPDFFGTLNSRGYNLIGSTNLTTITGITSGNILNVNARLAPLANNGGVTFTHQLLANSPAVDSGSNALAVDANGQPVTTDQRGAGFSRIYNFTVDIGAFEATIFQSLTLSVDTSSDDGNLTACTSAPNDCSLRGAITRSQTPGNFTISFDSVVFASPKTITLTNGQLVINNSGGSSLTISGSNGVTISGNNASRVFLVSATSNATFQGLTITGGNASDNGGGIYSDGNLTINNCTISGNTAANGGFGGGIIHSSNQLTVTNSTISGNSADTGGGIYLAANASLQNVTITNNSAITSSGGILIDGDLQLGRSIIAGNSAPDAPDILGNINSQGYNLIENMIGNIGGNTTGNILHQNARLAPLGFYGGVTQTHALLSGSPAINAGNTATSPTLDQRGAARIGTADIGAFELNNTANGGTFAAVLPSGNQNVGYNFTLVPNNSGFTYSVTSGILPNGLSLTTNFAPTAVIAISGTPTQSGTFNFAITATNGVISNVTNYSLFVLAPTAANVSVSGRVLTPDGRGLQNAVVTITDQNGAIRSYRTGSFGYYHFEDVAAGATYVFEITSKRFRFAPQIVNLSEDLSELNFTAQ